MWKVPDIVRLIRATPDVPLPVGSVGTVVDVEIDEPPVYFVEFNDGPESLGWYPVQEKDLELVESYRRRDRSKKPEE